MAITTTGTDTEHTLTATFTVWVNRGAAGNIADAVERVIGGVDAIGTFTVDDIGDVRPMATEIRVDVTATIDITVPGADTPADTLADGFGVTDVDTVTRNP